MFFSIYDHMIYILCVCVVYHFNWFMYVKSTLHPRNKSHLIMVYDLFNLNLYCYYFVEDFCIHSWTLILKLNSFQKAVQEMICLKNKYPLPPERQWLIIHVSVWKGCWAENQSFVWQSRYFFPWKAWLWNKFFNIGDIQLGFDCMFISCLLLLFNYSCPHFHCMFIRNTGILFPSL